MSNRKEKGGFDAVLFRGMLAFALPIMATGALQLLYNAVDIVVLGQFAGTAAQSAVSATSALVNLVVNMLLGLSIGVSVVLSRRIGEKNQEKIALSLHTALVLGAFTGLFATVFGILATPAMLRYMNVPESVLADAVLYLRIFLLGMPFNMVSNFGFSALRASGDSKRPLYYLTISGLVNVMLNIILIVGLQAGVMGVAIATITAQGISTIFVVYHLMKRTDALRLDVRALKIHSRQLWEILRMGVPACIQVSLFSFSNVVVQSTVNTFGDIVVAGDGNANILTSLMYVIINAVQQTIIVYAGRGMGAKEYRQVRQSLYYATGISLAASLSGAILLCVAAHPILSIFKADSEVIAMGAIKLYYCMPLYFTFGCGEVFAGFLRGIGYSLTPTIISLCGICLLRFAWVAFVFPLAPTLGCIYLSYPVSWGTTMVVLAIAISILMGKLPQSESVR